MRRVITLLRSPLLMWVYGSFVLITIIDVVLRFEPWLTNLAIVMLVVIRTPGFFKKAWYAVIRPDSIEPPQHAGSDGSEEGTTKTS
jgi:hypothetical protein